MSVRSNATIIVPIEKHAVPFDENSLTDWIVDSFPGDKIVYYRGLLAHDRTPSAQVLAPRSRTELNAVARRVFTMAGHGLVHPVQRRIGHSDFLYIAIKTKPRTSACPSSVSVAPLSAAAQGKSSWTAPVLSVLAA